MTENYRRRSGGQIDRTRPFGFTFNGKSYRGFAGDTLASALIANGVHLVSRSFKYHRPRGILTAGPEEPSALVQLETGDKTEPNLRATEIKLYDGLQARGVNAWPSPDFDLMAWTGALSKIFVAGFYYKTFLWPPSFWFKVYEPIIRRMAGLGRAPKHPDPDIYDHMNAQCDVLVVGAGAAGLMAALSAGRAGARVMLVDEGDRLGGALQGTLGQIDGKPGDAWAEAIGAELAGLPEVRVLTRTSAFGYYDHNFLALVEKRTDHLGSHAPPGVSRQRIWHVRAKQVVLATGAQERPLVFADNDRPGIMLASAAQAYVNHYAARPGTRAVVFTNNDFAYAAAADLAAAGVEVVAIVDARTSAKSGWSERAREHAIEIITGAAIVETRGVKHVTGVGIRELGRDGQSVRGPIRRIPCDLVLMSGGYSPAVHLFSQAGGTLRYDAALAALVPDQSRQACFVAGAAAGTERLDACLAEGARVGVEAVRAAGFTERRGVPLPVAPEPEIQPIRPLWLVPGKREVGHGRAKHMVDHQDDVTAADILLAAREGFRSVEHVKRYTTAGMGTDQGKTSNVNALAILAQATGRSIPEVGTTTYRAPYTPVTFGALAGRDTGAQLDPVRRTAMHSWHEQNGAVFELVGQWHRPWWYPKAGEEKDAAVARECKAVREAAGILDASTLGKIDIQGPDAAELLNRVYTNAWSKLAVGRVRYGLMCGEDGMVFDDGTTSRLAENHYLMTTTTGNAARVLAWLEEWLQTEWPELRVHCTSVTEQWASVALAGPNARDVLAALAPGLALADDAFPFMSHKQATVAGIPARVFRISFSGALGFEINVPWDRGLALWEALMAAGHGITPYGTEAMHVLRAEKGFIIVGQETDGTTTPIDLGLEGLVSKTKPDFIGKRSLERTDTKRATRKQLVGLLTDDPSYVLPEGAQLVAEAQTATPVPMVGHVTSSYMSPTLGRSIALALVKSGRKNIGKKLHVPLASRMITAEITEPRFLKDQDSG